MNVSAASIKRLRSKSATHHSDGPTITVLHVHPTSGAPLSTTGRLIAETPQEIALLVRSTPEVIATRRITRRSDRPVEFPNDALPVFSALVRQTFGGAR